MKDYPEKFSLKGERAVVTGGAGLLGSEIVTALAQAGAKVLLVDIDEKKGGKLVSLLKKARLDINFIAMDICDTASIKDNVSDIIRCIGRIDVWVNAAYPRTKDWATDILSMPDSSFKKNIDIHLNAYALICKEVALQMAKKGKGSIINLSSIYGMVGPDFNVYEGTGMVNPFAYAVIKGGIINMTRYIASRFGKKNVRANVICPGGVFDGQKERFVRNYSKRTPMNRMARPEEIASVVLFLSSKASSYITGAVLPVDGGWTAI